VVNGYKSAAHTNSPDGGTDKMCLGGGMHCHSASGLGGQFNELMFLWKPFECLQFYVIMCCFSR